MALPTLERQVTASLKALLQERCGEHLLELRVFGSRARGDARPDSDLDVFVLLDTEDHRLRTTVAHAAWDVAYELELPFAIQPLVMSRAHFDELSRRERLIARDIEREGISI